ncbi:MAG: ZIP family metal transporter [Nanoarchaeota archaeon]|nr:ZIP family metal transporter [Nanoarchaeota archaeon]
MLEVWLYALISVLVVSLISFVGIFTFSLKAEKLQKVLIYFVAFSAGALFAGAFLHLIPEVVEKTGFNLRIPIFILVGIIIFFIIEKIVCWNHCHIPITKKHVHSFAIMNLVGDMFHNFLDGLVIAGSYLVSIPLGITTTLAVVLHEIPQEISDFGILIYGGFSKRKALLINFATALTAVLGAVIGLLLSGFISGIEFILVPIAAGGFIYIAGSDLIPELHKNFQLKKSILQLIIFVLGILVMVGLLFLK